MMTSSFKNYFILCSLFFQGISLYGTLDHPQVGTLTQVQGTIKILFHPSDQVSLRNNSFTQAFYEGKYYSVKDGAVGDRVEQGNVIRTTPGSKAQVIFPNGDQFYIGSGTLYHVNWESQTEHSPMKIDLKQGILRGIIAKQGPRSHLKIRTKTAVMGVRGTDFTIQQFGDQPRTKVSIVRGQVEIQTHSKLSSPVSVQASYSAEISLPQTHQKKISSLGMELRKTTQEDYQEIKKVVQITPSFTKDLTTEVKESIQKLETLAKQNTLKDLQTHDPKLYQSFIEKNPSPATATEVNTMIVQQLAQEAPRASEYRKPSQLDFQNLQEGAYEKYLQSSGS